MIKSLVKNTVTGAVYYSGSLALRQRLNKRDLSAIILMYHRVMPNDTDRIPRKEWERYRSLPGIVVTPQMFESQIRFLSQSCSVISLAKLMDCFEGGEKLPPRAVVITFDDGWRDNCDYAFPILKRYGLSATIFLTANYIDSTNVFWPERVIASLLEVSSEGATAAGQLASELTPAFGAVVKAIAVQPRSGRIELLDGLINEMKNWPTETRERALELLTRVAKKADMKSGVRVMLDWNEIREMQAGGVSFGSHCLSHELLTSLDRTQQERELTESKEVLERRLGIPVEAVAYPNGNFNAEIKGFAARAGYRCALSVQRGSVSASDDRFELRRVNVHQGCSRGLFDGFARGLFACYIEGILG